MTHPNVRLVVASFCLLITCCNDDEADAVPRNPPPHTTADGPAREPAGAPNAEPTYWSDMAPLFAAHCLRCHSDGGIAPLRLDDYSQAKSFATLIEHVTRERIMPPWSVTSDGSCGEFKDSEALSEAQIELISRWVKRGAPEGKVRPIAPPV